MNENHRKSWKVIENPVKTHGKPLLVHYVSGGKF